MPFRHNEKIEREKMPQPARTRAIRYRYDWHLLKPGEGFEFGPAVKISSARVMCANNGVQHQMVFRCYRGVDEKLYAIRMDGLGDELPAPPEKHAAAPRVTLDDAPEMKEHLGDLGHQQFKENLTTMVTDLPPSEPMRYELHSNEAGLARLAAQPEDTDEI